MKIYDFKQAKEVYVVGDIHGEFKQFFNYIKNGLQYSGDSRRRLKSRDDYNNSVIIVAGDCGIGFNKIEYYNNIFKKIDELLIEHNTHIIFVRGNHDDPKFFNESLIESTNLLCVPDYSIIQTESDNVLCIGGGISIDRTWRIEQEKRLNRFSKSKTKKLYWDDEAFNYDENELKQIIESNIPISYVVTHIAPTFAEPTTKTNEINWFKIDKELKKDVEKERKNADKIFKFLKDNKQPLKIWAYGHYHISNILNKKNIILLALSADNFNVTKLSYIYNSFNNNKKDDNKYTFDMPSSFMSFHDFHTIHFDNDEIARDERVVREEGNMDTERPIDMNDEDMMLVDEEANDERPNENGFVGTVGLNRFEAMERMTRALEGIRVRMDNAHAEGDIHNDGNPAHAEGIIRNAINDDDLLF